MNTSNTEYHWTLVLIAPLNAPTPLDDHNEFIGSEMRQYNTNVLYYKRLMRFALSNSRLRGTAATVVNVYERGIVYTNARWQTSVF